MSKMRMFLIFMVVLMIVFTASSCKKKPTEPDDNDNYAVVNDEVVDVSSMTNLSEPVISGDTYSYTYIGTAPSIQVGDVLVGQTGYGYMRKVTEVQTQNNQIVCQTDSARIVDVIDECSLSGNAQLTLGELDNGKVSMKQVFLADGVSVTKDGSYHISSRTLIDNINFGKLRIKNTTLQFDPSIDFDIDISNGEITNLDVTASGTITSSLTIEAENLVGNFPQITLPPIAQYMSIMPYFFIGPVPVFAGVELCPVYEISIPNPISKEWTITNTHTLTAGAHCLPNFSPILEYSGSTTASTTTLDYTLGNNIVVKVGLMPRVKMLIGGVVGPKLGPVLYGKYLETASNNYYTSKILAGEELKISLAFDAFIVQLAAINYTVTCWETEILSHTSQNVSVASPTFSPLSGTYSTPQDVTISCTTSNAIIRYTIDGTEPTQNSQIYSDPISIYQSTTIKAKAYKAGLANSPTAYGIFTIDDGVPNFQNSYQLWNYCDDFDWNIILGCEIEGNNMFVWFEVEKKPDLSPSDIFSLVINNQTITVNTYDDDGYTNIMINNDNDIILPNSTYLTIHFSHNSLDIIDTFISVPSTPILQNLPDPIVWSEPIMLNWSLTPDQNNRFQGVWAYGENDYDEDEYDRMIDVSARQYTIPANAISMNGVSYYEMSVWEMNLIKLGNCILMTVCDDYATNDKYLRNSERIVNRIQKMRF